MIEVFFRDTLDNGIPVDVEGHYEPGEDTTMVIACISGSSMPIVITPAEEDRLLMAVIEAGRQVI